MRKNQLILGALLGFLSVAPLAACSEPIGLAPDSLEIVFLEGEAGYIPLNGEIQLDVDIVTEDLEATETRIRWSTMDASIVSVTVDGVITGEEVGTTTIIATSYANDSQGNPVRAEMTVRCGIAPRYLQILDADTQLPVTQFELAYDDEVALVAVDAENNSYLPEVVWENSAESVLSIDSVTGELQVIKSGQAVLTARSLYDADVYASVVVEAMDEATVNGMTRLEDEVYDYLEENFYDVDSLTGERKYQIKATFTDDDDVVTTNILTDTFAYYDGLNYNQDQTTYLVTPSGKTLFWGRDVLTDAQGTPTGYDPANTYTFATGPDGETAMQAMFGGQVPERLQYDNLFDVIGSDSYGIFAEPDPDLPQKVMPYFVEQEDGSLFYTIADLPSHLYNENFDYIYNGFYRYLGYLVFPPFIYYRSYAQIKITIDEVSGALTFDLWRAPVIETADGLSFLGSFTADQMTHHVTLVLENATDQEIEATLPGLRDKIAAITDADIATMPVSRFLAD